MNIQLFLKKFKTAILILLTVMALAFVIWMAFLWTALPHDALRENITIEEAQNLVSFSICLPTYTPPQVDINPKIVYESDAAGVPQETYVRLRYQRINNSQKVFEIYQSYTHDKMMKTAYPESAKQKEMAEVSLLYWIYYPKFLSESEMGSILKSIKSKDSVYQTNQTVWWLYKITDPIEHQSTMTKWIKDQVEYRIISFLPEEEIKKITLSMLDCPSP